jgi:hypothetical protein
MLNIAKCGRISLHRGDREHTEHSGSHCVTQEFGFHFELLQLSWSGLQAIVLL